MGKNRVYGVSVNLFLLKVRALSDFQVTIHIHSRYFKIPLQGIFDM